MLRKIVLLTLVVLVAYAVYAADTPSSAQQELPATLEKTTGLKAVAYGFFAVLAAMGLLLIYRGVKAH